MKVPPPCSVQGCERPSRTRGWCQGHYVRQLHGDLQPDIPLRSRRPAPEPCIVEGCPRFRRDGDYCNPHAKRVHRYGSPGPTAIKATTPPGTKKGRYRSGEGYVIVVAPESYEGKKYRGRFVLEHRLVMSQILGRPLYDYETAHHKNGDRSDNRPENLELWVTRQPKGQRVADKLEWAREIIDLYGDLPPEVIT